MLLLYLVGVILSPPSAEGRVIVSLSNDEGEGLSISVPVSNSSVILFEGISIVGVRLGGIITGVSTLGGVVGVYTPKGVVSKPNEGWDGMLGFAVLGGVLSWVRSTFSWVCSAFTISPSDV